MSDLLNVNKLVVEYRTDEGVVQALNGLSIKVSAGESLGLVGETGAGKTTLAKSIIGIIPDPPGEIVSGEIIFDGQDLREFTEADMRAVRGSDISMIFQDPMTALNPVMTVGEQIMEVILTHNHLSKNEAKSAAADMLELVGISRDRIDEYPHQFSGGMKQRVIIAIALACHPKLLIADEPTTALDVTIQAQVLTMMQDLKRKFNTAMMLITHDLGVVAQNCDNVAVVYAGEVVEYGSVMQVFKNMQHPYSQGLFNSIPKLDSEEKRLQPIKGLMPDPTDLPKGCFFCPRCPHATEQCAQSHPVLEEVEDGHLCRCWEWKNLCAKADLADD